MQPQKYRVKSMGERNVNEACATQPLVDGNNKKMGVS